MMTNKDAFYIEYGGGIWHTLILDRKTGKYTCNRCEQDFDNEIQVLEVFPEAQVSICCKMIRRDRKWKYLSERNASRSLAFHFLLGKQNYILTTCNGGYSVTREKGLSC